MRVMVTGVAGFIGFSVARSLLEEGYRVCGYDNMNSYYDVLHKQRRLSVLEAYNGFHFVCGDIENKDKLASAWRDFAPQWIVHLAAQAGVRYSLENPQEYIRSNIVGFQNVIEMVEETRPDNFVYASSSSVYGGSSTSYFAEDQPVDDPISVYAATKISNEIIAKTYSNLYSVPATGLRFFTVYGPFGRPDMAVFKFAQMIDRGQALPLYNSGNMARDFTYIDDVVAGVRAALQRPSRKAVYNLGRGKPENLLDMVNILEQEIGKKASYEYLPLQPGDLERTCADISKARQELGYLPGTSLAEGIAKFVKWYKTIESDNEF